MEIGTAIKFQRKPGEITDAMVIATEFHGEGESPKLHIVFLNPDRIQQLQGTSWHLAFDHAWSVPGLNSDEGIASGTGWFPTPSVEDLTQLRLANIALRNKYANSTEGRDEALQALADEGARKDPVRAAMDQF